jgi:hypothetical protein
MDIICVNISLSLRLTLFHLCFPHHYEYLRGLGILEEDAIGVDLGDCTRFDTSYFLGH